jgi:hypothetical protein
MGTPNPEQAWEPPISTDIELVARRELAQQALGAIVEVFDMPVTVDQLLVIAQEPDPSDARLGAKRALRAIEAIGREDTPVIRKIGETGIYHYIEGVVMYGAAEDRYLSLMENHGLTAQETTALYEIRRQVREQTYDKHLGFGQLIAALESIGIDPQQAATDTDAAVASMEQAGFFVGYRRGRVFDGPAFIPEMRGRVPLGRHIDDVRTPDPMEWVRGEIERGAIVIKNDGDE